MFLFYVHADRKDYSGRGAQARTATSTFTQLLSSAIIIYDHAHTTFVCNGDEGGGGGIRWGGLGGGGARRRGGKE